MSLTYCPSHAWDAHVASQESWEGLFDRLYEKYPWLDCHVDQIDIEKMLNWVIEEAHGAGLEDRHPLFIIKKERGGTYEGKPKAKKTTSISTRLPAELMQKLLDECREHDCSKSTLLLSILTDRYR
jgi:hypothetical protein